MDSMVCQPRDEFTLLIEKTNKRPKWNAFMVEKLSAIMAQRIVDINCSNGFDFEDIVGICTKILHSPFTTSAFELCKTFDDEGLDVDLEFHELMDCVENEAKELFDTYIEFWVNFFNIEPEFKEGDEVKWKGKPAIITGIRHKTAKYTLYAGGIKEKKKDCGYIVKYEDVQI